MSTCIAKSGAASAFLMGENITFRIKKQRILSLLQTGNSERAATHLSIYFKCHHRSFRNDRAAQYILFGAVWSADTVCPLNVEDCRTTIMYGEHGTWPADAFCLSLLMPHSQSTRPLADGPYQVFDACPSLCWCHRNTD